MGQAPSTGLKGATERAADRVGKLTVSGRYHKLPRRLEDDYEVGSKVLGTGYSGSVVLARNRQTGVFFAVKAFKTVGVDASKKAELASECEIFLAMDHPHIVRLVDVYESEGRLDLVMECLSGGELFTRVKERKRFSEKEGADAAYQMLLAVNYIHSHGVVHRDLKLENFLYESERSTDLKLIDFGFSKIWKPNTKMALSCGTLSYVAPEVLKHSYTSQCDLWSLGVVVFIVLFGFMPFYGPEERQVAQILSGRYLVKPDMWAKVSSQAQDFIRSLLVVDPRQRLKAEQALAHPWISNRDMHANSIDKTTVAAFCRFGEASTFRRACLSMMAWSLTEAERQEVKDAFLTLDKDRSGTITSSEFKQVLMEQFHFKDQEVSRLFEALDTSGDDEIHYSEFLAAMVSTRIAMHEDLLKATFQRFDRDSTGFITVENLEEVLGEAYLGTEVEKLLKEADFTGDGKISYEEWLAYLREPDAAASQSTHKEVAVRLIDDKIYQSQGREQMIASKSQRQFQSSKGCSSDGAKVTCGCEIS